MKYFNSLFIATCVLCLSGWGQEAQSQFPESYVALLRSDIQAKKTGIVQQNLALSDDQAKKFWPLQRSYESDLSKLGDQRLDVIRDYTKNWGNLSDNTARDLGKRLLDYQKKRVELRGKYFDRMSKEISPTIAAKFFQIETQMEDMIDLEISSSVPLIK
ncbi:MAG TPA: hypothetical protein VHZ55_10630 [Bryobacteraceae bacterium]|jgi:hypothetical protein|nr:hypothetical protein [Bryobacteraceae bacterium]